MPEPTAAEPSAARGRLIGIIAVLLILAALHFARPVMLPFVAGLLIAALSWPAYRWLQHRIPRGLALLATVLLVTSIVLALFGAVGWGAASVVKRLQDQPERLRALQQRANAATQRVGLSLPELGIGAEPSGASGSAGAASTGDSASAGGAGRSQSGAGSKRGALAKRFGVGVYSVFGYLALAIGFAALTLSEVRTTPEKLDLRFGQARAQRMLSIVGEVGAAMRRYVRVKSITSIIAGVSTGALSLIFGIEFAALWAFLAFLFEYVPTIGSILAVVPPVAYAFIQFDSLTRPLVALAVFTVAQLFLGNYVDPRIEGRLLSLSPLVVLLSIVFWAWLWGAPGSLLGVPIVVAVTVVARHFEGTRWIWATLTEPDDDERDDGQRERPPRPGVSR